MSLIFGEHVDIVNSGWQLDIARSLNPTVKTFDFIWFNILIEFSGWLVAKGNDDLIYVINAYTKLKIFVD